MPSDRLRRQERADSGSPDHVGADDGPPPVVIVEKVKGALRLAAVDPKAARAGLSPGLTLADAQARIPELRTITHRPDLDDALLTRIVEDFGRFSPMVAADAPHGLLLDVTGCGHLFGGEAGLVRAAHDRARRIGLEVRSALACTPQAARALSRFGPGGVFAPDEDRAAVRRLSVAAMELPEKDEQALRRAGLKRIADLDDRPRAPLAARFGADFPSRLARVLGQEDVRITPSRPAAPCIVDRILVEPITRDADIEGVLSDLLIEAADRLDQAGQGGRAFEASFYRVDGEVRRIMVRTGRPTREAPVVLRLFRERLAALAAPLDPGFGFDQMRLSVPLTQTLRPTQRGLEREPPGREDFSRLVDRLTAKLGPEAVLRFEPQDSHMPERAVRTAPAAAARSDLGRPDAVAWPEPDPDAPPMRPLQMFDPPQLVETLAEVPDGSPLRFRWRRVLHEVVRSEGPERIAGEWWRAPDQKTRDYYRVEDRDGRRFWLFRQGLFTDEDAPRWFIHGLFA